MAPDPVQRLDPQDLDAVLQQAKAERWTDLALLGPVPWAKPEARQLIRDGWRAERVFLLKAPLDQVPPALAALTGLTSLDLRNNEIGEAGAASIAKLTGLTSLNLGGNRIGEAGAASIARLTGLTSLNLWDNRIGEAGAASIAKLTGLTSLDLGANQIGDAGAASIARLTGLTSLNLWGNPIGDAGAASIASLTGLTSLNLGFNRIGEAGAASIASLTGLTSLDLGDNQIGEAGAASIAKLTGLTSLDLGRNRIGEAGAASIASLTGLTSLALGDNQIGDAGAASIARLTGLTSLDLRNNRIGEAGAASIAKLTGLTSLALAGNRIGDAGAASITKLTGLTSLDLGLNRIGDAGAASIAKLTGLTSLALGDNQIGEAGAASIAKLTGLTSLALGGNRIGDAGAASIAKLTGLTSLDLAGNRIGDAGAASIAKLTGLTSLDLAGNRIGEAGAASIARLTGLTSLNLGFNQIGEAGGRAILDAWADPATADRRRVLDLHGKGDLGGLLPAEVLQQPDAQALIAAWRQFRDAAPKGELRPLNEAKLIVVGKGNVGKTSLVRYLTTGQPRNPSEPATEGVRAYERIETKRWTPDDSPFTLNIWDFGGQEIYFGTHRYFMTARSLYLLVLDDRTDGPNDAEDWLRRIRSHAADAPVIVVVNKAGEGGPGLRLDEAGLAAGHGPILAFHRTSCDPGNDDKIAALRAQIVGALGDVALMPEVHRRYPEPWWQVKDALAKKAQAQHWVGDHAFRSLCEAQGLVEESDQRALLATLNNLGTVVAHGLDPGAREVHRATTLLDPNWLTQAIYAILGSARVRDQHGEFAPDDLDVILDPEVYPQRFHEQIVALMQDERLGLCLRLHGRKERYLLPAALPPSVPTALATGVFRPCRRYRYTSLPGDLLPRFMVQLRALIAEGSARWRDGVVLTLHGCELLVCAAPVDRRVDVGLAAGGAQAEPRRAMERIEDAFDELHRQFGAIGARAFVPLPDLPEEDVELEVLRRLDREGSPTYRHEAVDGLREFLVAELLSGRREVAETGPPEPARLGRFLVWLETWPGTAAAASALMALAALVLVPVPWREWDQKAGWAVVIAVVTYLLVRRSDPELIYRRLLWLTVPGGLAMLLLGLSFQVGFWTPEAFVQGRIGSDSVWAPVVAVLGVTSILAIADHLLTRLRRSR
jgi:internalin A